MSTRQDEMSLRELWAIAWRGRFVIAAAGLLVVIAAVAYSLAAQKWYRAEVVLAPAEDQSAMPLGGQLSGIAALAGIGVGGSNVVESVATLRSKQFVRSFVEDRQLLTVLFSDDWDADQLRWKEGDPEDWPDIRSAVEYFQRDLLSVSEDRQSGLVTVGIEWTDPEVAAEWANELASRVNAVVRERALRRSAANVEYLKQQLSQTDVVDMKAITGQLLAAEMQKLMMAKGNPEFAFRVIDSATTPKEPVWPRMVLLVVLGAIFGLSIGFLVVYLRHAATASFRHVPMAAP